MDVSYFGFDIECGGQVLFGWKLGYVSDFDFSLCWGVLSDVLFGNVVVLLIWFFIELGLGLVFVDFSGYCDDFCEVVFVVGFKGLSSGKVVQVQELVLFILWQIVDEGIDLVLIEVSLYQFEISQKEVSNVGYFYGFGVMFWLFGFWMNGGDLVIGLCLDVELSKLCVDLECGLVFEDLICYWLLDNFYCVILVVIFDFDFVVCSEQVECELVVWLSKDFIDEDCVWIVCESFNFKNFQVQEFDLNVLLILMFVDVFVWVLCFEYIIEYLGWVLVGCVLQLIGGLIYFDVKVWLFELFSDLLLVFLFYVFVVMCSGVVGQDYVVFVCCIEVVMGGIVVGVSVGNGFDVVDEL